MPRRVREYIQIEDTLPLDQMIRRLGEIQRSLPSDSFPEMRSSGDDRLGRKLTISYFREMTEAEAELEASYAAATLQAMESKICRLREQLEVINNMHFGQRVQQRAAA